jgi:preprotein translocase subunit YajC
MIDHLFVLVAQTPAPAAPGGGPPPNDLSSLSPIVFLVFAFVLMYFLTIRPQRKKQLELEAQIKAVKTGDKVITNGGIHGVVANVRGDTATFLTLRIADNVKIDIEKSAIATIVREKTA